MKNCFYYVIAIALSVITGRSICTKVTPPYNHVYQTKNFGKHERELSDGGQKQDRK